MLSDNIVDSYLLTCNVPLISPDAPKTSNLEAGGWRSWLMTLVPFAFEEEFSADHIQFWDLYWSVLMRIKRQKMLHAMLPVDEKKQQQFYIEHDCSIEPHEYVMLLLIGRGLGKSATLEASSVMRGAILGTGYNLGISEAQDQAEEHLANKKQLIEHPDSRLVEYYPGMAIADVVTFAGIRAKDRADLFITVGGWICRAKGLNSRLRGLRIGNLRPDDIELDDIDSVNDSIAVSYKKLTQIKSSIIPTQARRWVTIKAGQNLILETGVFNQIYLGQSDALAERTTIGVSNTFEQFRVGQEYLTYMDEADGRIKHKILPAAKPTWSGVRISDAQKFLNDSGLETFLAEYMNSFIHLKNEKVFAFDEARHLITWEQFESMFGVRHIPGNWRAKASADIGFSRESLSAWLFVARSSQNSKLSGRYFGYRSRTFTMESIDDQAIKLWEDMFPNPAIGKKHFEAQQQFANYPDLFRMLETRPRCSQLLKNFSYDHVRDKYNPKEIDPFTWKDSEGNPISDETKALFYVRKANETFKSQIQSWVISHEKTGEQKTLSQKYGLPVAKVERFEADAGVAEANHLLRGDYTTPHPFHDDEIVPETGLYRLGSPYIFFIVRRVLVPESDEDFKTFREHVGNQRWTQEKLGDSGLSKTIPMKYRSDHADAFRHFSMSYALPESTPKTMEEQIESRISDAYKPVEDEVVSVERQMSINAARKYAEELTIRELGLSDDDDDEY